MEAVDVYFKIAMTLKVYFFGKLFVYSIAMSVINIETGEQHLAKVTQIDAAEIAKINSSKQFDFNWNKEKEFKVFKLTVGEEENPVGLLSLMERPEDFALEIRLIASAKTHIGKKNGYDRIAGCLISFACRESFKAGYEGFVCLKPKTKLESHYMSKYGFESTKLFLVTEGMNSWRLIKEYYEEQ